MSEKIARLLYEGAHALVAGRRAEAREKLLAVIELDERNIDAWLWLSGAVEDPADQQVALENVLTLDPDNQRAQEGLAYLRQPTAESSIAPPASSSPATTEWTPPPEHLNYDDEELDCWKCGARLYAPAVFCWQCHAAVHCCNNCRYVQETRCKQIQGLLPAPAHVVQNECPWWYPRAK